MMFAAEVAAEGMFSLLVQEQTFTNDIWQIVRSWAPRAAAFPFSGKIVTLMFCVVSLQPPINFPFSFWQTARSPNPKSGSAARSAQSCFSPAGGSKKCGANFMFSASQSTSESVSKSRGAFAPAFLKKDSVKYGEHSPCYGTKGKLFL